MYNIESNTHRVTQYVISEAYKWLYKEIENNKYSANKNREAKALLLKIKMERCVTEETYNQFLSMMDHNLFIYLITCKKVKAKNQKITSNHVLNYFVTFNGVILPLGFIFDFFEDEYETEDDCKRQIAKFIESERTTEFENYCRDALLKKSDPQAQLKENYPFVFRTPIMFYVTQGIRALLTVVLLAMFVLFLKESSIVNVLKDFIMVAKFDIRSFLSTTYPDMTAFLLGAVIKPSEGCTYAQYFSMYSFHISFNLVLVICLIVRIKRLINFIAFLIRSITSRVRCNLQEKRINFLEDEGIDTISAHFKSIAPTLVVTKCITEDMIEEMPPECAVYTKTVNFNLVKIEKSIQYLYRSTYEKLHIIFRDESMLQANRRYWRRGFISTALFCIVVVICNVPGLYASVIPELQIMWDNIMSWL